VETGEESRAWAASLSPALREEIRGLHALRAGWNAIAFAYAAALAGLGWVVLAVPSWPVRGACWLAMGACVHALGILMHEGVHGNLFRDRRRDRLAGLLLGLPHLLPFSAFRVTHLLHHRHNRTALDPDEFGNLPGARWLRVAAFYGWILGGTLAFVPSVPAIALRRGTAEERRAAAADTAVVYGALAAALALRPMLAVELWLIPFAVSCVFGNVRGVAEHMLLPAGDPLRQTRTVTSNRAVSFLMCNLNYHLAHHLFPGVPWYRLQGLHRRLSPLVEPEGAEVWTSYLRLMASAIRAGPFRELHASGRSDRTGGAATSARPAHHLRG